MINFKPNIIDIEMFSNVQCLTSNVQYSIISKVLQKADAHNRKLYPQNPCV